MAAVRLRGFPPDFPKAARRGTSDKAPAYSGKIWDRGEGGGFRALCYVERGRGYFMSRNGNDFRRFDTLGTQVATALGVDGA